MSEGFIMLVKIVIASFLTKIKTFDKQSLINNHCYLDNLQEGNRYKIKAFMLKLFLSNTKIRFSTL